MNDICWSCGQHSYHDYKDKYGIRCPSCGQKENDDPAKAPKKIVEPRPPYKAVAKRTVRSK